ncbi:MAG: tetratricopeptide repeat protein [Nostoc indistinguendum CM1-VF10]|nr:tetratricopeptide repeat protein [Nostoc indistinguendum CM1-VF10]
MNCDRINDLAKAFRGRWPRVTFLSGCQGDTKTAVSYWQESLEIDERIGNFSGKGATLNNMAEVIARQGNIEQALYFWQESLKIIEHIG